VTSPVRTCVGCGARAPQPTLTRFVSHDGELRLDAGRRRHPGRGAYLHDSTSCRVGFVQRRGAVRSLRAAPSKAAREALVHTLAAAGKQG
jgi:predicted RNA-binding protein YlxR (DUF448 family)